MMKGCLLLLGVWLSIFNATAQPYVDVLNLKAQLFPSNHTNGNLSDSLSTRNFEASFLLPLVQKNKDVFLFGGNFSSLEFDYSGSPAQEKILYSTLLAVGYEKQWKNPAWKTLFMALPRFNSDFEANTTSDFQMGGFVLSTWEKSDSLKFHFGLYYNREFFGNYFMPIVGIDWKINSRLHLFGDLPSNINLEYKLGRSFYLGFLYQSGVASYRLENGNYVREGDKFWGYDQFKAYFHLYLNKHIVWFVEGGVTYGRLYKIYTADDVPVADHPVYGQNLDGAVYATGLAYRFRLDEK
jgi:hypothetical protein